MDTSTQPASQPGDFNAVRKSIIGLLKQPEYDDGSAGPVLVRLAWYETFQVITLFCLFNTATNFVPVSSHRHSAGTYDAETDTGGSNGAGMRYEAEGGDPANAGLQNARLFLEPVKALHPWITYAGASQSPLRVMSSMCYLRAFADPIYYMNRPLDLGWSHGDPSHGWPRYSMASRPDRLRRRQQTSTARTAARRSPGRRPYSCHLLPDGLQRQGDRCAMRGT